jgi:DTW domain-containing protein YfiP
VREALSDPARQSFLVYPAEDADDLSSMTDEEVVAQFRQGAMFWIVDGSWSTARKMVHQSENLKNLPKVIKCLSQRIFRVYAVAQNQ